MFGSKKKALEEENARLKEMLRKTEAGDLFDLEDEISETKKNLDMTQKEAAAAHARLQAICQTIGVAESIDELQATMSQERKKIKSANNKLEKARKNEESTQRHLDQLNKSIISVQSVLDIQETGLYVFKHPAEDSVALKDSLKDLRLKIRKNSKVGYATTALSNFTFNGSKAQGKKFVKEMSTLSLIAYNAEAENCIKMAKAGQEETAVERLRRMADRVEKNGELIKLRITRSYSQLREQEIGLATQHLEAVKQAKELEKEERARIREEKKAQQEIQKERDRLEKERQHYVNALSVLGKDNTDESENIKKLLDEVEKGIEDVDYRQANVRAGYVYVISNIGSFGPNVIKIGMTRRLNPMDRVRELGDASVPFGFDVHALFFSEDAVGVEAELHRRFADRRVNRINLRREYFYATPIDVKEDLSNIAGALLEFTEEPEAEQYRLSQALNGR